MVAKGNTRGGKRECSVLCPNALDILPTTASFFTRLMAKTEETVSLPCGKTLQSRGLKQKPTLISLQQRCFSSLRTCPVVVIICTFKQMILVLLSFSANHDFKHLALVFHMYVCMYGLAGLT